MVVRLLQKNARGILRFPEDILLSILCACEVEDVLALEMTCTMLRKLVASRQVWLAQLQSLDQYHAPDIPPHISLSKISVLSLRSKVLRAVRSYRSWSRGKSPRCTREKIVRLPEAPSYFRREMPAITLVPGGEYLTVFWLEGVLEIIDVQTSRIVWMYPPVSCRDTVKMEEFGIEARDDGSLMLIACLRSTSPHLSESTVVFLVNHVEPQKNRSTIVFQQLFHEDPDQFDFVECAKISGDIAVVCMTNRICVINWADFDCVELSMAHYVDCIEIVGSHIICAQHAEDDDSSLVLMSIDHVFESAMPPRVPSSRSTSPCSMTGRWRRLNYRDAISQLVLLKLPKGSSIITQRLSFCTPSWQLPHSRHDRLPQASTIHFTQFIELPGDARQYISVHRFTFYPGQSPHKSLLPDPPLDPISNSGSLMLDSRVVFPNPVPDTVCTTGATGVTRSGRVVIACVERDSGAPVHFAFSLATVGDTRAKQCGFIDVPRKMKGHSLEMETYSEAVVYVIFPSKVAIRYYD